jgi:hypothetical protein
MARIGRVRLTIRPVQNFSSFTINSAPIITSAKVFGRGFHRQEDVGDVGSLTHFDVMCNRFELWETVPPTLFAGTSTVPGSIYHACYAKWFKD